MRRGLSDAVLIACIAAAALVASVGVYAFVSRPASPVVVNPSVPVSGELATIKSTLAPFPKQSAQLSAFYGQWSQAIERSTLPLSTGQFRTAHGNALKVFVASEQYAGAPAVGTQIDAYIGKQIGTEDKPLDGPTKATLVAALKAISQATGG